MFLSRFRGVVGRRCALPIVIQVPKRFVSQGSGFGVRPGALMLQTLPETKAVLRSPFASFSLPPRSLFSTAPEAEEVEFDDTDWEWKSLWAQAKYVEALRTLANLIHKKIDDPTSRSTPVRKYVTDRVEWVCEMADFHLLDPTQALLVVTSLLPDFPASTTAYELQRTQLLLAKGSLKFRIASKVIADSKGKDLAEEEFEEAEEEFEKLLKENPNQLDVIKRYAALMLQRFEMIKQTIPQEYIPENRILAKAFQLFSKCTSISSEDPDTLYSGGVIQLYQGKTVQASLVFEAVIQKFPEYAPAIHKLGECALISKTFDLAATHFSEFLLKAKDFYTIIDAKQHQIDIDFVLADTMLKRGICFYMMEDMENADTDFSSVIRLEHAFLDKAYMWRARSGRKRSEWYKVIEDATNALNINGNLHGAYHERALAYQALGNNEKAEADLNVATALVRARNWKRDDSVSSDYN